MSEQQELDIHRLTQAEISFISSDIESSYGYPITSLEPLLLTETRRIFKAIGHERPLVVRSYAPEAPVRDIQDTAANLLFLEKQSFPAERLVKTKEGTPIGTATRWHTLMTTFIEGKPIKSTPNSYQLLGETLGKLHSLDHSTASPPLPASRLLPKREVAYALSELTSVREKVPMPLRSRYEFLESSLHNLPNYEDLPKVFIHSDCHPGNGVQKHNGDIVLYDWQDAGLGPAIVDLSFLLLSCDRMAPWLPQSSFSGKEPWPDAMLRAIASGYTKHRALSSHELDGLPDALRFRSLIFGAVNFSGGVAGYSTEDESLWWWKRYTASDAIAERVKRYLAR